MHNRDRTIIMLSMPLVVMVVLVSSIGLFTPDFYFRETTNWQVQSRGQDAVDLFLVIPVLLITSFLAYRNNKSATLLWGGVLLYLFYTFVIYCFDVHFNRLFIFYCITLGLLFYALVYFMLLQLKHPPAGRFNDTLLSKIIGIYFLFISTMFYFLWLSEIIPATAQNIIPKVLAETGLPTNPVHVIDLSVILPGIFITGILVLRKKRLGFILAPVLLMFFILMDITIGALMVMMKQKGLEAELAVAYIMAFLALLSAVLLYLFLSRVNKGAELKP